MNKKPYQICTTCIMDTSDSQISFDVAGVCKYCRHFEQTIQPNWHTDARGEAQLHQCANNIKKEGKGKAFDCILGLSGGLDSSYTAYLAKEVMGLRPLLLHVDAGWNTNQAVSNIEKLVDGLGLDLYTEVINWENMKQVQLAFLKSQIPDQDLPQDAAFFSALYQFAKKYKIKYILTGSNYSTECCREPVEWGGYLGIDKTLFRDICKKFSTSNKTFPLIDIFTYKVYYRYRYGMRVIHPLNHTPFIKKEAEKLLYDKFKWESFLHKHHESRFTRFFEDCWLPQKFGYEKRRAHFSSLIMTGQLSRDDALIRIAKPELDELTLKQEFEYVANKLGISVDELQSIFEGTNTTARQYKNKMLLIKCGTYVMNMLGVDRRLIK